ncbi:MAG: hypothetical protein QOD78_467 [Chloroflexota bacterium]|jgi:hypothetical protein|nr:hypothetical protein [Chloroflexota bacterium]
MANGNERAGRTGSQRLDEMLRGVRALTSASKRRHRLARDTPEYTAALETEARLADHIWGLGAALGSDADDDREPAPRSTETSTNDQGARKT